MPREEPEKAKNAPLDQPLVVQGSACLLWNLGCCLNYFFHLDSLSKLISPPPHGSTQPFLFPAPSFLSMNRNLGAPEVLLGDGTTTCSGSLFPELQVLRVLRCLHKHLLHLLLPTS